MTTVFATLGFTPEKLLAAVASIPDVKRVVVYTAFSREGKERAENAIDEVLRTLRMLGIEAITEILRSPWDFLSIFETMLTDLTKHSGNDIVFNLTGGPKTMTVAATMASVLIGIPLVYFPEEEEKVRLEAIDLPVLKLPYSSLLTQGQRRVLAELVDEGGRAMSAKISRALNITPPSLEYHLKNLLEAGIIEVTPFKEDRRHRIVEMTPSGRLIMLADEYMKGQDESPKE